MRPSAFEIGIEIMKYNALSNTFKKIERLTIKSQARNAEERQKFRRFKRGIAKLTSFWTPT